MSNQQTITSLFSYIKTHLNFDQTTDNWDTNYINDAVAHQYPMQMIIKFLEYKYVQKLANTNSQNKMSLKARAETLKHELEYDRAQREYRNHSDHTKGVVYKPSTPHNLQRVMVESGAGFRDMGRGIRGLFRSNRP